VPHTGLDALLSPRSIAVVGGSERADSVGEVVLSNLRASGFAGPLYVVNHKHDRVQGLPSWPSVRALPGPVDLAVLAVPAAALPAVMAECGALGVRSVLVLTAGFAELGDEGARRQAELASLAHTHGMRMLGPNSVGLVRPSQRVAAFFGRTRVAPGRLALVSQSGAVCTAIADWAQAEQIGFSLLASIGGTADVGFGDLLAYLAEDTETDAIVLYVEGLRDARTFMEGLRAAARRKPVVVLKAGRGEAGRRAVVSHTGALAGDEVVFDAALRRAGGVRVDTLEQLFSAAEILARGVRSHGARLAVLTNAGGLGVMAADHADAVGVKLATLSPETRAALDVALPAHWSRGNPVDVIGDAGPSRFRAALTPLLADDGVDAVLVLLSPQAMTRPADVADEIIAARAHTDKPLLACFMGGEQVAAARTVLSAAGVTELPSPEAAVEAFSYLAKFQASQRMLAHDPPPTAALANSAIADAHAVIADARARGSTLLTAHEARRVLHAFGIPVLSPLPAADPTAAVAAADTFGYPVALKIDSPDITHKTEVGGVMLDLRTPDDVSRAFSEVLARAGASRPDATLLGVTVEPMVKRPFARELLVGLAHDATFGPAIMVGVGGTLVELIADRVVQLPPLDPTLAADMLDRMRARTWLGEFRGMPPVNHEAVIDVLLRVSQLACALPEVHELDLNPLLADDTGALALDARIVLSPKP
jgi:acetyltransferase